LIAEGSTKLASVPSGGAGGAAPAAGGAAAGGGAAEEKEEEKKEEGTFISFPIPHHVPLQSQMLTICTEKEESDEDMGFGLFD